MFEQKKMIYFLPNTFTALNMACGFVAIINAFHGAFYKACMFIFLAAIFDTVDGRVARLTNTQSSFGEQFDSLSDLISFGIAPAMIFYFKFLSYSGRIGLIGSFLFLLCGALRLARFNASIDKNKSDFFQGLPIPSGAMALVGYVMISLTMENLNELTWIAVIYLIFYSVLMISNIPFPSFKNSDFMKKYKKLGLLIVFIVLCSIFLWEEVMIIAIISAYVLGSLIYYFLNRNKFRGIFDWVDDSDDEILT